MRFGALGITAALGVVLLGCPKEESPPADDRLLQKLQAEKDRLDQGGAAPRPIAAAVIAEPNPLAARAAMPDAPKTLPVVGAPDFSCGAGACRISSVETSHSVAGAKLSLTSDDYFVKVVLWAQLPKGGPLDFGGAKLVAGANEYPIARDAQTLSGSRELARTLKPGEKVELVLFFEAPKAAIAPGLKLIVVGGDGVSLQ
ncbi:MAG: hypothetical protein H6Q89_585 [Myxococcaceae bacterium]|nr:hypothetical protein [Myxococcaceae bacterium]